MLLGGLLAATAAGAALGALTAPPQHPSPPPGLAGRIRAPGGPFLLDGDGRVVILHGVNVVYKRPPFEVYPDPGKPWNFSAADARRMARLGFDVVRLGMTWQGLEPGTAPANTAAICSPGPPSNPHQYNAAILYRYLRRLAETVDLLGRFHIYSLLDMHQDVYNQLFEGDGAPNWAVCTDGVPSTAPPGRWSLEYGTRAAGIAYHHFWTNDVAGDLQGQYDMVWGKVASFFRHNPWVIGYDPFNEPFSTSILRRGSEHFDGQLECFYTGTARVGGTIHGAPPIRCPEDDPRSGVIPTILSRDPDHLIFDEPDIYASRGYPTYLGPMDEKNLVYNVHIYCPERDPVTGNPTDVAACAAHDEKSLSVRSQDRPMMASPAQPGGPAWLVTEFGATSSVPLLRRVTAAFDRALVGWIYWSWKYYGDPTGSQAEALVRSDGRLRPSVSVLSQTYAQAIAGMPLSMSFDSVSGAFSLRYRPAPRSIVPTVVFVSTAEHYRHGYCARVTGGHVVSPPGTTHLLVANDEQASVVSVHVTAGTCRLATR